MPISSDAVISLSYAHQNNSIRNPKSACIAKASAESSWAFAIKITETFPFNKYGSLFRISNSAFASSLKQTGLRSCPLYEQLRRFARLNESSSLKRDCLITWEESSSVPPVSVCHKSYGIRGLFAELKRFSLRIRVLVAFTPKSNEDYFLCYGMEHDEHLDLADKNLIVDNLHTLKDRLEPVLGFTGSVGEPELEVIQVMYDVEKFRKLIARK